MSLENQGFILKLYFYKKNQKTMNFALTVIGIVLGGIATLVTLVFAIISLSTGKQKNAGFWALGFAAAISILIFSIITLVQSISSKVKDGIEWIEQHDTSNKDYIEDVDQQLARNNWIDTLRAYTNGMYEGKVPADFYSAAFVDSDSLDRFVAPFLYPYSIRMDVNRNVADIIVDVRDTMFVQNVSQMAFDENFVIAKIDNNQSPELLKSGHAAIEYLLFDMRTGNFENAPTYEKLMDFANRIGYVGSRELKYVSELYSPWMQYEVYD